MLWKKLLCLSLTGFGAACSNAQELPIVGLWEKIPVSTGAGKLVARTSFIFTNKKLAAPTLFSGLRDSGDGMDVLCCVEVKNLVPLRLNDIVKKYAVDTEFGDKLKSIKGLPFMYEAVPVAQGRRNESFQVVMNTDKNPDDTSPYSSAVISLNFEKMTTLNRPYRFSGNTLKVGVTYPNNKDIVVYEFNINDQRTVFSERTEPH